MSAVVKPRSGAASPAIPLRRVGAVLSVLWGLIAAPGPAAVPADWVDPWRTDLALARVRLPEVHPDFFHNLPREEFEAEMERLAAAVPSLAHHEIVVQLARIIARAGDGHTRVTLPLDPAIGFPQGHSETAAPRVPGLRFRQYPVRIGLAADGPFIQAIDARFPSHAGHRLLGIGGKDIRDVMEQVATAIHRDNESGIRRVLPHYLVIPEVLHALGVVEAMEKVAFTLEGTDGRKETLLLDPVPPGGEVAWAKGPDGGRRRNTPWAGDPHRFYWFETLPGRRTVYVAYNRVANQESDTVAAFSSRLAEHVATHDVDRVILDLRHNDGGDGTLNRPLIHALLRMAPLQERGHLFTLIGPNTFSAAMMFCVELERHLPVLFVGEPTGSSPNHFGDSRKVVLPASGLTVRVSTLYWQLSDPRDGRDAIAPHFPVVPASTDYREGRDPALEWILQAVPSASPPTGRWKGSFAPEPFQAYPVSVRLARAAGAWEGSLEVPGSGLDIFPLREVTVEGAAIRFLWPYPGEPIGFRGTRLGDRLVGDTDMGGRTGVMILERVSADTP